MNANFSEIFFPIMTFVGLFMTSVSISKRSFMIFPAAAMSRVAVRSRPKVKLFKVKSTRPKGSMSAYLTRN